MIIDGHPEMSIKKSFWPKRTVTLNRLLPDCRQPVSISQETFQTCLHSATLISANNSEQNQTGLASSLTLSLKSNS